jgi:pimeloyl-ACP methyl ester carboxylesterase
LVIIVGGLLLSSQSWRAVEPPLGKVTPTSPKTTYGARNEHPLVAEMSKAQPAPVQVYLLLGGLVGSDGSVTSAGMFQLAKMLRALPDTTVATYTWDRWPDAHKAILANEGKAKIVVIGYSGGGSRATWLANMPLKPKIDLMVYYDPSPKWQMKPLSTNVTRALCYHNTRPMMWVPGLGNLGGGELVGETLGESSEATHSASIEIINIAEQHMLVQADQTLHRRTVEAVRALASAAPARSELSLASMQYKRLPQMP